MRLNNICCIGGIYTGAVSCAIIAYNCPEVRVTVVDDAETTSKWNAIDLPFLEPGIQQLFKKCRNRNLFFSTNYEDTIQVADLIFLPYNVHVKLTMGGRKRELDFKDLEDAARMIAMYSVSDKIIVEKSSVSATASEKVTAVLKSSSRYSFRCHVLSNPEFITQSAVVEDLLNPEYILIGCQKNPNNRAAAEMLSQLYEHWVPRENIIVLNNWSVEVTKMAEKAFLAQKICSLNALSIICEETGADFSEVTKILSENEQLQLKTAKATLGFGKFQKDIANFILTCDTLNLPEVASYWEAVLDMNNHQTERFVDKIKTVLDPLEDKLITVLGFSTEKNSIDTTNSPAIMVCEALLKEGCHLRIFDPAVPASDIERVLDLEFLQERKKKVQVFSEIHLSLLSDSSAIIICTDWNEFLSLDYSKLQKSMKTPMLFDGQNLLNGDSLRKMGIQYYSIGFGEMDVNKPCGDDNTEL